MNCAHGSQLRKIAMHVVRHQLCALFQAMSSITASSRKLDVEAQDYEAQVRAYYAQITQFGAAQHG
eukprot:1316315-Amphidinium_carterae.1